MARNELPNIANNDDRETLMMMGGLALIVLGAGLVMTSPTVRRFLGQASVGGLMQKTMPDLERYLKLRSM